MSNQEGATTGVTPSYLDPKKKMADRKSVLEFIQQLQQNKEAYALFYQTAEDKGIIDSTPQRRFQFDYHDTFIKPQNDHRISRNGSKASQRLGKSVGGKSNRSSGVSFVPLKDLLRRGHDDRVQDYLSKLNEQSQDQIVVPPNNEAVVKNKEKDDLTRRQKQLMAEVKQMQNGGKAPMKEDGVHSSKTNPHQLRFEMFEETKNTGFTKSEKQGSKAFKPNETQSTQATTNKVKLPKIERERKTPAKQKSSVVNSPLSKKKRNSQSQLGPSKTVDDTSRVISAKQRNQESKILNVNVQNADLKNDMQHHELKEDEEKYTSDGGGSIADTNEKIKKKKKGSKPINKNFQLDKQIKEGPLKACFERMTNYTETRQGLSSNKLKKFLALRYKEFLANRITGCMAPYLGEFKSAQSQTHLDFDSYTKHLENFFNQDENELKKFAFRIFDVNGDNRLSEQDMFDMMKYCSAIKGGYYNQKQEHFLQQQEMSKLHQKKEDLFLDVFSNDFIRIIKDIERRKKARGIHEEQTKPGQSKIIGLNTKHGNELSFGKNKKQGHQSDQELSQDEYIPEKKQKVKVVDNTPAAVYEAAQQKMKKNEDKTFSITQVEFVNINFAREWPFIIKDLAKTLTGVPNILKSSKLNDIYEADEIQTQPNMEDKCKETDLAHYRGLLSTQPADKDKNKETKENGYEYYFCLNAFRCFEGKEQRAKTGGDIEKIYLLSGFSFQETVIYLEEKHFIHNFSKVFGPGPSREQQFFGKLLYIHMSKGYDRAKISYHRFLECFYPLFNQENRQNHNKIAFKILDMDNDNSLNILNLLHLQSNLSPKCILGNEIFKLVDYFINNYLTKKNQLVVAKGGLGINYDIFSKILKKSCIVDYMRERLFGLEQKSPDIFAEDPSIKLDNEHILREADVMDDISMGQRGYKRNLDYLLAYLIEYYRKLLERGN